MILHNSLEHFRELIAVTANSLSLPAIYIEKDYYVTRLLHNLSCSAYKNSLIFKGGTSLSKAYKLIERFSEDVDLAICVEGLSEHKYKKLMKNSEETITEGFNYIQHPLESKRGAIRKTYYNYPKAYEGDFGHASEFILLEINSFSHPFPYSLHKIQSFIGELLQKEGRNDLVKQFCLESFELNVLDVKRTVAEKIMALVKIMGTTDPELMNKMLENKIRHIYDLCMIASNDKYKTLFQSDELLTLIQYVRQHDEENSPGDRAWLALPLSDVKLFSSPEYYLEQIKYSMQGSFSGLVYFENLPDEKLIVRTLSDIHQLLLKV